jgi:hypothetical protein
VKKSSLGRRTNQPIPELSSRGGNVLQRSNEESECSERAEQIWDQDGTIIYNIMIKLKLKKRLDIHKHTTR